MEGCRGEQARALNLCPADDVLESDLCAAVRLNDMAAWKLQDKMTTVHIINLVGGMIDSFIVHLERPTSAITIV